MFAWMEELNDAQRAAVSHDGGPLRVLAGAGTGKTTALSARVAWLLATGTPAERILLLTFTRGRPARCLIGRVFCWLHIRGKAAPTRRRAGCWEERFTPSPTGLCGRYAQALGIPEGFSVLDPSDAADVIDLVREEGCYAQTCGQRFPRKALLLDLYSRAVNTGRSISTVTATAAPWANDVVEQIIEICRGYVAAKRAGGMLDFDDLLLLWRAAALDDRLGPQLAGSFDHILVDEYQDVNGLQVDILKALRRTDERITIVGDDAQAVYSFRAAEPRHILGFRRGLSRSTDRHPQHQLPIEPTDSRRRKRCGCRSSRRVLRGTARRERASRDAPPSRQMCRRGCSGLGGLRADPRGTGRKVSSSRSKQSWCGPHTIQICSNSSSGVDEFPFVEVRGIAVRRGRPREGSAGSVQTVGQRL